MDAQQLIAEFLHSEHGAQATQALAGQGIHADDAQPLLSQATEAAHGHLDASPGLLGDHAGKSFFAAFASGLVRGDGFFGSMEDGGEGVLTGRVAESLAGRAGVDGATASSVAAIATPYLVAFLKQKLA